METEAQNAEDTNDVETVNPDMIQIKAKTEEEVMRRVRAFMENKRNEINERNIREFISPFSTDCGSSCARVEAVYIHRESGRSHIAHRVVNNATGPQTRILRNEGEMEHSAGNLPFMLHRAEAVEERLANMEGHLGLDSGYQDIYSRVKALEKRISFLEGLSPEYFSGRVPEVPKSKSESAVSELNTETTQTSSQSLSLSEINLRIRQLKESLQQKALDKDHR